MTFEVGNPGAALRQNSTEKLYRKALMLELKACGPDERGLRLVARKAVKAAHKGEQWAVNHVAERIDGKVPQALVADSEDGQLVIQVIQYTTGQVSTIPQAPCIDITPTSSSSSDVMERPEQAKSLIDNDK